MSKPAQMNRMKTEFYQRCKGQPVGPECARWRQSVFAWAVGRAIETTVLCEPESGDGPVVVGGEKVACAVGAFERQGEARATPSRSA